MLIKFVDDTIERRVNMIDDSIKTEEGFDRVWNRIEIKMLKCKILYLGEQQEEFTAQCQDGRK